MWNCIKMIFLTNVGSDTTLCLYQACGGDCNDDKIVNVIELNYLISKFNINTYLRKITVYREIYDIFLFYLG